MRSRNEIDALLKDAAEAGLEGLDFAAEFDYETIAREYNGVGSEWLPQGIRDRVTAYLAVFEPAALLHDLRYSRSDGSDAGFRAANAEFLRNCLRLANRAYPWWNWRRYRARAAAMLLFDAVEAFGGLSWGKTYGLQSNNKRKEAQ